MDLVPYAVPFFLALIGIEYMYGVARNRDTYRLNDCINSLSLGILSTSVKIIGLNWGGKVFSYVESDLALTRLDPHSQWTWVWALLLYDFCYYWFHRISHERQVLWAAHVVHHQSEEFNLSTALRQTGTGFLISWVFYIPCFLSGVPASVFVTVASVHLIYQFWIHTQHIPKLGLLEWFMVTASNHRVHHAQNPRYVDRNYGGLLIIWDRLFGTFEEERDDDVPVYGILGPLHSWNPLWANVHIYANMLRDMWAAAGWRDRLQVLVARTGWRPQAALQRYPSHKTGLESFKIYDPPLVPGVRIYVGLQFLVVLGISLWIDGHAAGHGLWSRLAMLMFLTASLISLGLLMEPGVRGRWLEALRIVGFGVFGALATMRGYMPASILTLLVIYMICSVALLGAIRPGARPAAVNV